MERILLFPPIGLQLEGEGKEEGEKKVLQGVNTPQLWEVLPG